MAGLQPELTPTGHRTSHCCYCSMQCGVTLHESGDGEWVLKPDPDFPVAAGRLCQKGFNAMEHVVSPERILRPMRRAGLGGSGRFAPGCWATATWEEACSDVAWRIRRLQERHGRDAMAVYGGGSLTNETAYLLGKFARVGLRTKHIDYNGRYCMSTAAAAQQLAFGLDRGMSMPLAEIVRAEYLILSGTNIAECQPTMMSYLLAAKKNGARIVTVDPRRTMTAKSADIHVPLQPGFDSVFVNGLLHVILEEGLADETFIRERTAGVEALREQIRPFTPDLVSEWTGILPEMTRTIARGFAKAKTGIVLTARGLEQQVNGVENTLNYINLCLVTGKIGRPGCGYGAVTGQGNGQGGREHGQKADQLPGYRSIDDPEARNHAAAVWGVDPAELPGKGVSAFEMIRAINRGEIKGLLVMGSNPVVSSPNSRFVEQALGKLELLVVADLFVSETAALADWLLPAASFLEQEGTLTNLEGRVFHRDALFHPAGESRCDYRILSDLAEALGRGSLFRYNGPEAIFTELSRASAGGAADYGGMDYSRIKRQRGLFWPCPSPGHPGTPDLYGERFCHADGKARIHAIAPKLPAETPDADYPFILTTGRLGNHYLSGAQTRRSPKLNQRAPFPAAEIHPSLAEKLRLKANSRIRLTSRRGTIVLDARISDGIHPRTIFVPFHWGGRLAINQLTQDALDPRSRMPEFKICAVRAERVDLVT